MSNKSIKVLGNNFKSVGVLEEQIVKLKRENTELKDAISKLLVKFDELSKNTNILKLELTPEQLIIEQQINFLKASAMARQLTLEETKMLDIHIKNKRLLDDKSTLNADYKRLPEDISDEELMRIAQNVTKEKEGSS